MKVFYCLFLIWLLFLSTAINFASANEPVGFSYETEKPSGNYRYMRHWVNDKALIVFVNHSSTCCGEYSDDEAAEITNDKENIAEIISRYESENQIKIPRVAVTHGDEGEYSICYKLERLNDELKLKILSEINFKIKTQKFSLNKKLECSGVVYELQK